MNLFGRRYLAQTNGDPIAKISTSVRALHWLKVSQVKFVQEYRWMIKDVMQIRFNDWVGRYR